MRHLVSKAKASINGKMFDSKDTIKDDIVSRTHAMQRLTEINSYPMDWSKGAFNVSYSLYGCHWKTDRKGIHHSKNSDDILIFDPSYLYLPVDLFNHIDITEKNSIRCVRVPALVFSNGSKVEEAVVNMQIQFIPKNLSPIVRGAEWNEDRRRIYQHWFIFDMDIDERIFTEFLRYSKFYLEEKTNDQLPYSEIKGSGKTWTHRLICPF